MSIFNKAGEEFTHLVLVPRDPNTEPTYSHPFPVLVGAQVKQRWAHKVRPIKDMTRILSGARLRRDQDYMVDFNGQDYEYWFKDSGWAVMFQLAVIGRTQALASGSHRFDIECPHCHNTFDQRDIVWR